MSRREKIRMTEDEQREFLANAHTIIISSIGKDGVPHPMPMWFGVEDDGVIVMSTFTKSQKIKNLERDPRVSLLVEDGEEYSKLRGVVIYGKAELVRDDDEVVEILMLINSASLPEGTDADALRTSLRATAPKRTGIRVRPDRIVTWDHSKLGGTY
ncbi:MAG: PPOX class F420-dependent oxidoreductase [Deltaproteobacteria bacterium]|nr:PPOX class F420-dependent oxidoreductase [Deltaproteobacteria bacterium]MBW2395927.1 PPOX class F420-dependent oxidoreductase [Deltaproteobacteria bacterium]